jgi:hypothetical protein
MLEALETLKRVIATFASLMVMASALLNGSTHTRYTQDLEALKYENAQSPMTLDSYGGWVNAPAELGEAGAGAYFRVEKLGGKWWFITPDGNPFLSKGVTDVNWAGPDLHGGLFQHVLADKYSTEQAWSAASRDRMDEWGFNTVGPWSSHSMTALVPHSIIILDSAGHAPRYPDKVVTDVWSQGFEDNTVLVAQQRAAAYVNDKNLLGYFLDNELVWGQDHFATNKTLLQLYMEFPAEAPGRLEAIRFMREAAGTVEQFNQTWNTKIKDWPELDAMQANKFGAQKGEALKVADAFKIHAFKRYAEKAIAGLRSVDPNHLILGCRFHSYPGDDLIRAAAGYFDVISMASYEKNPFTEELDKITKAVDKPFLIEEWSFKSFDSGIRQIGVFGIYAPWVLTQKDRAFAYADFVKGFMSRPYAVGYHWYKWWDNPRIPGKVLSGDNCGLLNQNDEPYTEFVKYVREVNLRVESWHAQGGD